jgi:hypothetical protein
VILADHYMPESTEVCPVGCQQFSGLLEVIHDCGERTEFESAQLSPSAFLPMTLPVGVLDQSQFGFGQGILKRTHCCFGKGPPYGSKRISTIP